MPTPLLPPPVPVGTDLPPSVRPTLVVASDLQLVAEAVSAALSDRGIDSRSVVPGLNVAAAPRLARMALAHRPVAGLVVCDLDQGSSLHAAVDLVAALHLRWLVLTRAPEGPIWGDLLQAGALAVMPVTVGLDTLVDAVTPMMGGARAGSAPIRH